MRSVRIFTANLLGTFAATAEAIEEVEAAKADKAHTHKKSDITDFPTSMTPTSHASSATTYGKGDGSNYGHLRLSNSTSSSYGTSDGYAATPSAVKAAYDLANGKADKAKWVSVTISTSGWVSDTSVPSKPYRYDISVSGVTASDSADINLSDAAQETAAKCGLSARAGTAAGKIQLRAKTKPSASMSAEYRIIQGV